jgi:hypothetical protein
MYDLSILGLVVLPVSGTIGAIHSSGYFGYANIKDNAEVVFSYQKSETLSRDIRDDESIQ